MIYKSVVINNTAGNMPGLAANFNNHINSVSKINNIQRSFDKKFKKNNLVDKKKLSLAVNNISSKY